MIVTEKADRASVWNGGKQESSRVTLSVAGGEENKTWCKYTPGGHMTLEISNPVAFEAFKLGKAYFVDFTEAPFAEKDEK